MSDVSITYKGAEIASLDASGTKTLLTSGKYCEDDIEVAYTKPSGGGTELQSDFFVIRKETITAGANTVTNTSQHYNYLAGAKSIPGTVFAFSAHKKDSYVYDEIGVGTMVRPSGSNGRPCYRYRNGWSQVTYDISQYDAKLVEGTVIDIYTYEMYQPST